MRPRALVCIALGLSLALATPVQAEPPTQNEPEVIVPDDDFEPVPIEPNLGVDEIEQTVVDALADEPELHPAVVIPPDPPPPPMPTTCAESKRCRGMRASGIVIGTLGLAAVGTGVGLLVTRDQPIPDEPAYVTSTRPAGLVTLTIGVGVTLTALLMLVAARQSFARVEPRRALRFDGEGLHF